MPPAAGHSQPPEACLLCPNNSRHDESARHHGRSTATTPRHACPGFASRLQEAKVALMCRNGATRLWLPCPDIKSKARRSVEVKDNAEPVVVAAVLGVVVDGTVRYTTAISITEPAAAAENTITARRRPRRVHVRIRRRTVIGAAEPIVTPLPDITCHIMQAVTIG